VVLLLFNKKEDLQNGAPPPMIPRRKKKPSFLFLLGGVGVCFFWGGVCEIPWFGGLFFFFVGHKKTNFLLVVGFVFCWGFFFFFVGGLSGCVRVSPLVFFFFFGEFPSSFLFFAFFLFGFLWWDPFFFFFFTQVPSYFPFPRRAAKHIPSHHCFHNVLRSTDSILPRVTSMAVHTCLRPLFPSFSTNSRMFLFPSNNHILLLSLTSAGRFGYGDGCSPGFVPKRRACFPPPSL